MTSGSDVLLALNGVDATATIRSHSDRDWTDTVVITSASQVLGMTVLDVYLTPMAADLATPEMRDQLRRRQLHQPGRWVELT